MHAFKTKDVNIELQIKPQDSGLVAVLALCDKSVGLGLQFRVAV